MALLELHPDQGTPAQAVIPPVVVGDWWCRSCGRPEAAEDTRLCPECASYRTRSRAVLARQLAELSAVLASAALLAGTVVLRHRSTQGEKR
jgi:hypothetical protein